jgi:hypothetical protein
MSRRSFLLALGIFAFLGCTAATTVFLLVRYEPRRYREAALPPGPERVQYSRQFYDEFWTLVGEVTDPNGGREWGSRFTEQQINGYLNEGFVQSGLAERLLPERIRDPRVVIEEGRIRLAFRYGDSSFWSTVISIDFGVWLSQKDPNVVALQLQGFHAGAMPISAQSLLERISEVCRQNGIEVTWYRHEGHPVALLRFQADQPRPTLQLRDVRLERGAIVIQGRSQRGALLSIPGPVVDGHPIDFRLPPRE